MKKLLLAATVVAGLGFAGAAQASSITASLNLADSGVTLTGGPALNTITAFTAPTSYTGAGALTVGALDNTGLTSLGTVFLSPGTLSVVDGAVNFTKSWTVGSDTYTATFTKFATVFENASFLNGVYTGTLSDTAGNVTGQSDIMTVTLTTAGGVTGVTLSELSVPEPATIAILGMGLLGLGLVRRRRA